MDKRLRYLLDKDVLNLEELEEVLEHEDVSKWETNGISGINPSLNWYTVHVNNEEYDIYLKN